MKYMSGELLIIAIVLASAFLAAAAQYLFKKHITRFSPDMKGVLSLARNRGMLAGAAIYAISLAIYLDALRLGELSFVYPAFASVFVFVLLISRFKLREKIGLGRIIGVALVVAGIAVVALTY